MPKSSFVGKVTSAGTVGVGVPRTVRLRVSAGVIPIAAIPPRPAKRLRRLIVIVGSPRRVDFVWTLRRLLGASDQSTDVVGKLPGAALDCVGHVTTLII